MPPYAPVKMQITSKVKIKSIRVTITQTRGKKKATKKATCHRRPRKASKPIA